MRAVSAWRPLAPTARALQQHWLSQANRDSSRQSRGAVHRGAPGRTSHLSRLSNETSRENWQSPPPKHEEGRNCTRAEKPRSNRQIQAVLVGHAQAPQDDQGQKNRINRNGIRHSRSPGTRYIKRPTKSVTAEGNQTHTRAAKLLNSNST